ncbi:hypothetical protein BWI96_03295 [Siphonobacter sp. SORGH_AS_0500]|nr:hypothetical protein BWI96_03295 [Siphonobacter sp. SORGH_AS_0500]
MPHYQSQNSSEGAFPFLQKFTIPKSGSEKPSPFTNFVLSILNKPFISPFSTETEIYNRL